MRYISPIGQSHLSDALQGGLMSTRSLHSRCILNTGPACALWTHLTWTRVASALFCSHSKVGMTLFHSHGKVVLALFHKTPCMLQGYVSFGFAPITRLCRIGFAPIARLFRLCFVPIASAIVVLCRGRGWQQHGRQHHTHRPSKGHHCAEQR